MEFEKIVHERYATKLFDGKKLPEDKLDRLFEIIRYAPSSFNIQPWKIIVVKEQKLKEKEKAIELRKQGKTYSDILRMIPVAKSTLGLWLKDAKLSKSENQRFTEAKRLASLTSWMTDWRCCGIWWDR